ncbi:ABC transporter substrate-binding protein [Lactiplantibacillus daowaiensis]|uniref:ABC transporter substrate-binding protein n=1 Tax=Lactiplantibacillus daowaiensis TaxID=2559918 RepID=A0ABW1RWS0_9LACO|nr:ABC transporter substrate-binding protein [Lactiplantibacillus daowaiensis]
MKAVQNLFKTYWQVLGVVGLVIIGFSIFGYARTQVQAASSRIKVVFWHEMKGPGQQQLNEFIAAFNKSQSKYEVVPQFQGSYNAVIQKVMNTHGTSASPAVFQSMDISTSQMYHSGYTVPVQKFIDRDHYDIDQIASVARGVATRNGKLLAMPFNTSQTTLFYNAGLFKKYGIKPLPVSPSYSDISRVSQQLYQKSNHQIKGMSVEAYSWLFEQFLSNANEEFANQHDGHTGISTKVNFTGPVALESMKWLQGRAKAGDLMNYGDAKNETAAFLSGKLGLFMQSSADTSLLIKGLGKNLGVTYYPHPDGVKPNGISVGGASLWIANDKSAAVQEGAWEFTKFLVNAQNQAKWEKATGYLAINTHSAKEPVLKKLYAQYPMTKVPGDQLRSAQANYTNSGIFIDGVIAARALIENAMQQIYAGKDVYQSLKTAENSYNKVLKSTNRANGRG